MNLTCNCGWGGPGPCPCPYNTRPGEVIITNEDYKMPTIELGTYPWQEATGYWWVIPVGEETPIIAEFDGIDFARNNKVVTVKWLGPKLQEPDYEILKKE